MAAAPCFFLLLLLLGTLGTGATAGRTRRQCQRRKFLTFNAGLTPRIDSYSTRRVDIPAALAATDADVTCLQEVWSEDDMAAILEATKQVYPHSFSFIHHGIDQLQKASGFWDRSTRGLGDQACSVLEGARLGWCLATKCSSQGTGYGLLPCLKEKCPDLLPGLSPDCRTCVVVSSSSLSTAVGRCGNVIGKYNRFNPSGLLLLSKRPIGTATPHYFIPLETPQLLPRGYIDADVNGVGRVLCTHLSANMKTYLESYLPYKNSEEQQRAEIRHLNATYRNVQHVLMGDLNMGPRDEARGLTGEFPANYQTMQAIGYTSPYESQGGQCTYCGGINILLPNDPVKNILDHVMSRSISNARSKRLLELHEGRPLSDHYAVQVEACV